MNKPFKRFIVLGLTISLASVPTLSEVSKANEINEIQEISLLSTEIDAAMQSVKVDQLTMDDFALTILEQPDIVDLEVMEDLPEHQQTMREDAEDYLKDIKPELIDMNERSILVAEYMSLYNDYFVSEIEKVQEKKSSEQDARQNIEAGLQDLTFIIEKENTKVTDTQKEIGNFLVNLEEDYEAFEASVVEAEEYVISREGEIAEEIDEIYANGWPNREGDPQKLYEEIIFGLKVVVAAGIFFAGFLAGFKYGIRVPGPKPFPGGGGGGAISKVSKENAPNDESLQNEVFVRAGGMKIGDRYLTSIPFNPVAKIEGLNGLQLDLVTVSLIRNQASTLVKTVDNMETSLETLADEWAGLQGNIQIKINNIYNESVNHLLTQFSEASIFWEETQHVSEMYRHLEENKLEIDINEIVNEEDLEEALKEAYDVDELIDISELTDEELKELLRDLLEEELDEAA